MKKTKKKKRKRKNICSENLEHTCTTHKRMHCIKIPSVLGGFYFQDLYLQRVESKIEDKKTQAKDTLNRSQ